MGDDGSNGHSKKPIDLGLRDAVDKLCGNRIANGGWCHLVNEHEGVCEALPQAHGPRHELWHRHRGQQVPCGKVTGAATVCGKQKGHGGKC